VLYEELEMNQFILEGCIKLIKSDSKNIYNVTSQVTFIYVVH